MRTYQLIFVPVDRSMERQIGHGYSRGSQGQYEEFLGMPHWGTERGWIKPEA